MRCFRLLIAVIGRTGMTLMRVTVKKMHYQAVLAISYLLELRIFSNHFQQLCLDQAAMDLLAVGFTHTKTFCLLVSLALGSGSAYVLYAQPNGEEVGRSVYGKQNLILNSFTIVLFMWDGDIVGRCEG